ncbi:MAG: hypothetical protein IH963_09450 [Chloroflexi bacterium]|nr:hypothetical protein [Chloroflexota bacterium]
MNDNQKTKEQLLEELAQGRALLERAEERSLALPLSWWLVPMTRMRF